MSLASIPSPPQQRIHLRRIPDVHAPLPPPITIVHKHSKTFAFSIIRGYNLSGQGTRQSILFARMTVQESFTRTRTTAKLNTYGWLEEQGKRDRSSGRQHIVVDHTSPSGPVSFPNISATRTGPVIDAPKRQASLANMGDNITFADSDLNQRRGSISDQSTVNSLNTNERPSTRTRHAEAYGMLDTENLRAQYDQRLTILDDNTSFFRRLLPLPRLANGTTSHKPTGSVEGIYKPPWIMIAPRSKREELDLASVKLRASFKDVGLLPLSPVSKPKRSSHSKQSKKAILECVPEDCLFMLLPMWPGETDPISVAEQDERESYQAPPLEKRFYLLLFYTVPEARKHRGYHVNARFVSYGALRGSGVRLPVEGVAVTGTLRDAFRSMPDGTAMHEKLPRVIGIFSGRDRGIEFLPDGLEELGLMEKSRPDFNSHITLGGNESGRGMTQLNPIGQAVAEIVWAGCLSLSCFGPT